MACLLPSLTAPALIMIDFQRDFCAPGGYADQHGGVGWAQDIISPAASLLDSARTAGIPIIHTREGYAPDLSDCHPVKLERSIQGGCGIGSPGPLGRLLIRGEEGHDFIPELYPARGETVIDKASYCAFRGTNLAAFLESHHVKEILLAGVTADVCVHTTLRTSVESGYRCYYIRDAISTFDPDIRNACERMIEVEGGIWGHLTNVASVQGLLEDFVTG